MEKKERNTSSSDIINWQTDPLLLDPEPAPMNEWLTANSIISSTQKAESFKVLTLPLFIEAVENEELDLSEMSFFYGRRRQKIYGIWPDSKLDNQIGKIVQDTLRRKADGKRIEKLLESYYFETKVVLANLERRSNNYTVTHHGKFFSLWAVKPSGIWDYLPNKERRKGREYLRESIDEMRFKPITIREMNQEVLEKMIDEELMKELEEQPIEEITKQFIEIKPEEVKKLRTIIRALVKKETLFIHQLVCMMIEEQIKIGYKKEYTLSEFIDRMPWKKSQLSVKLQKVVKEGVILHQKRKYTLNFEHIAVKRLWRFYTEPNDYKKQREEAKEIQLLTQEKEQLEEEIRDLQEQLEKETKYKLITEKEIREFSEEIAGIVDVEDDFDKKEILKELLKRNKEKLIGYK